MKTNSFRASLSLSLSVITLSHSAQLTISDRYKIGDSFIQLPLEQAQSLLSTSTEQIDAEVSRLEDALGEIREELSGLKAALYARFGKAINLDV